MFVFFVLLLGQLILATIRPVYHEKWTSLLEIEGSGKRVNKTIFFERGATILEYI